MFVIRKHLRPASSFFFPLQARSGTQTVPSTSHVPSTSRTLSTTQPTRESDDDASLKDNPFYEKYESKIKKLKESGVYGPPQDQYSRVLQKETKAWKQNIQNLEKRYAEKKKEEGKISGLKLPTRLDSLFKVELLVDKSADEISRIWTEYWSGKETISAVIKKDVFDLMAPRIKECPLFLYPLPREQGYEFYLTQFSEYHCFCTSLINYQVHGEDAPWQLCFKFYPELSETKGIVLMASEFDGSSLSILEVQYLAQLQQLFYANPSDHRLELMRNFNYYPDSFKYMDIVKEIESGDLIVKQ